MTAVTTLLCYLKKKANEEELAIAGNTYTAAQIKLAEQILADADKEFRKSQEKPKLSRRRSFIVILEELYYDVPQYPVGLTLDSIHKKASQRFEFVYRDLKEVQTPQEIHPKDPCAYFEDEGHRKARYRAALSHLIEYSERYFQIQAAARSLENTYKEILLC